jgi:hypothetical protein
LKCGHLFVGCHSRSRVHHSLAYLLAYHRPTWSDVELTVEEGIAELASHFTMALIMPNRHFPNHPNLVL